jgi:hypothetical protein
MYLYPLVYADRRSNIKLASLHVFQHVNAGFTRAFVHDLFQLDAVSAADFAFKSGKCASHVAARIDRFVRAVYENSEHPISVYFDSRK